MIELLELKKEIVIRGQKIEVKPLLISMLFPLYDNQLVKKDEVPKELLKSLLGNVGLVCNVPEAQLKYLTETEKMLIIETAYSLDPDIKKKSIEMFMLINGIRNQETEAPTESES